MDNELLEELEKLPKSNEPVNENLEEAQFIANCLMIGLRIDDLKQMEYKDVVKILLCFSNNSENKNKKKQATQNDWDALAR